MKLKISFCTVSMNRLHHLKLTVEKNILANLSYVDLEYVLLDYNSTDGTEYWVLNYLQKYIESGILKYYRTTEPVHFDRSHSRNMAFRLAGGDLLCNVDADNFLGVDFAGFINETFNNNEDIFLTPNFYYRDVIGRLVIKRLDFERFRGYNESMSGYGFEDLEFYKRLSRNTVKHLRFFEKEFLEVIHHSNEERFKNEFIGQNCVGIYLRYINPDKTEIIYFYKDGSLELGCFLDNEGKEQKDLENDFDNKISLEEEWIKGSWEHLANSVVLKFGSEKTKRFYNYSTKKGFYGTSPAKKYFKVESSELQNHLKLLKSEMDNRFKLKQFLSESWDQVNNTGYGQGRVLMNFKKVIYLN